MTSQPNRYRAAERTNTVAFPSGPPQPSTFDQSTRGRTPRVSFGDRRPSSRPSPIRTAPPCLPMQPRPPVPRRQASVSTPSRRPTGAYFEDEEVTMSYRPMFGGSGFDRPFVAQSAVPPRRRSRSFSGGDPPNPSAAPTTTLPRREGAASRSQSRTWTAPRRPDGQSRTWSASRQDDARNGFLRASPEPILSEGDLAYRRLSNPCPSSLRPPRSALKGGRARESSVERARTVRSQGPEGRRIVDEMVKREMARRELERRRGQRF